MRVSWLTRPMATVGAVFVLGTTAMAAAPSTATVPVPIARTSTEFKGIQTLAQKGALVAAPSLQLKAMPAGLKATDFNLDTLLDEQVITLDDLADHRDQAKVRPSGRKVCLMTERSGHELTVFVRKQAGKWGISQIRGSEQATPLHDALRILQSAHKADGDAYSLITIPALHLTLLGHRENGVLMVTPLEERQDLNLSPGPAQPAAKVFTGLAEEAKRWAIESAKFSSQPGSSH